MSAFMDGTCSHCKKRYGWTGEGVDKTPCPRCGHKPDVKELEELANDDKEMEEFKEILLKRKDKK